jgi:hypothetical protein
MRLRDILNATGKILPYAGFFIGTQSFMLAKEAKSARIEQATAETNRLLGIINSQQDTMINDQLTQNKIAGLSSDVRAHLDSISSHSNKITNALERLKDPNLSSDDRTILLEIIKTNDEFKLRSLNDAKNELSKIIDAISSNRNQFINDLSEMIARYKDFLSSLTLEQLLPFLNILGLIVITSCLISIAMIFYGDYIIKYFELEKRYPKMAKIIRLRIKFNFF